MIIKSYFFITHYSSYCHFDVIVIYVFCLGYSYEKIHSWRSEMKLKLRVNPQVGGLFLGVIYLIFNLKLFRTVKTIFLVKKFLKKEMPLLQQRY